MFSLLLLLLLLLSSSETKEEEVALSSSFSSSSYSSALRRSSIAKALCSSSSSSSSELEIGDDFSDDAFVEEEEAITASAMTWSGPDKTCARPNAKPNAIKEGNDAFSSNEEEEETIFCLFMMRAFCFCNCQKC